MPNMDQLFRYFQQIPIFIYKDPIKDGLNYWRERILVTMLTAAISLSAIGLIPTLHMAWNEQRWLLIIADLGAFLLVGSLLFIGRIGLKWRALAALSISFLVGIFVITSLGFASGGPAWLFFTAVAAGVLLGLKYALGATCLNAAALAVLGWLTFNGVISDHGVTISSGRALGGAVNFIILNAMGAIAVAALVSRLQRLNQDLTAATESAEAASKAKDSAEAASKAKSAFLANMSHELRTPLNHIIGFTDLVLSRDFGPLNAEQEDFLKDVMTSSRHLLSLINDVLDLSKVEAGKMELELVEIRVGELLRGSLAMVKEKALKHQLRLAADLDGVPDRLQVDGRKLKQVLYNLLSNAVKFTPHGGEVRLGAEVIDSSELQDRPIHLNGHEQWLSVWVSDTGIGLESRDLKRIFDPFEQVEDGTSRKYQGTGLGLSLTRKMVELHSGTIWAESDGAGLGSIFKFVIPARYPSETTMRSSRQRIRQA